MKSRKRRLIIKITVPAAKRQTLQPAEEARKEPLPQKPEMKRLSVCLQALELWH